MAIEVTEIYRRHPVDYDAEMARALGAGERPLAPERLHIARTEQESRAINAVRGPAIIISSSGNGRGGPGPAPPGAAPAGSGDDGAARRIPGAGDARPRARGRRARAQDAGAGRAGAGHRGPDRRALRPRRL